MRTSKSVAVLRQNGDLNEEKSVTKPLMTSLQVNETYTNGHRSSVANVRLQSLKLEEARDHHDWLTYFCQSTPLHGFASIGITKAPWKRVFWSCLIVACMIAATDQIIKIVVEYRQQKTAFGLTLNQAKSLKFPDVLLCDVNPNNWTAHVAYGFDKTNENGFNPTLFWIRKLSVQWDRDMLFDQLDNHERREAVLDLIDNATTTYGGSFSDLVYSLGHDCKRFLGFCSRGARDSHGRATEIDCCTEVKRIIYQNFGACYVMPGTNTTSKEAIYGNFGALLNVYAKIGRDFYQPAPFRIEGIFLGVSYYYHSEFDSEFLTALPGSFTLIHLIPKKTQMLNRAASPCRENSVQSVHVCRKHCEMRVFQAACNCTPIVSSHLAPGKSTCEPRQQLDCMFAHKAAIKRNITECEDACQPPCIRWSYQTTVSAMPYQIDQKSKDDPSVARWERISNINVFFSSLEFVEVQQFYTMTMESLFGNIGGLFSIYTGGSTLAVLHCIFTAIEAWIWGKNRDREAAALTSQVPKEDEEAISAEESCKEPSNENIV